MPPELPPVNLLVEGPMDRAVVSRILEYVGLPLGTVYGENGKPDVLQRIAGYNQAARHIPWVAVVDLDQDKDCAPPFVRETLPNPAQWMRYRVVVRAIESWLMADAEHLATFLHVPRTQFPADPDSEANPKATLITLVRRYSTRERIVKAIVPREGSGTSIGPGYTTILEEFVKAADSPWRPAVASQHSDSLRRCTAALESLKDWQPTE
jgi:hypothetical protein